MTKGECPPNTEEHNTNSCKNDTALGLPSNEELNPTASGGHGHLSSRVFTENNEISSDFGINETNGYAVGYSCFRNPSALTGNSTTGQHVDIAKYIDDLQNPNVRGKLIKLLSQDLDESDIDVENIDHYLLVARSANSLVSLERCENKLIENINNTNCEDYYKKASSYGLKQLLAVAETLIENKSSRHLLCRSKTFPTDGDAQNKSIQLPLKTATVKPYESYYAMFSCGNSQSKRTVSVVMYDSSMNIKVCKSLQKSTKISKQFECCCVQPNEDDADLYIFWCFGKSVHRYDPILLKHKKRASLNYKRSKFSFVALFKDCFVIGGEYQMHRVYEIEKYSCNKNKWKKVALLPRECLPIDCSCVTFNDCVYIFSAMVDESNQVRKHSTGVYIFHPVQNTVKKVTEVPFWFSQIKLCVLDSFVYLASDRGLFIRFCPADHSVCQLNDQILVCKDFGIFCIGDSIICVGGKTIDGECTNALRRFSTLSNTWDILPVTLPTHTSICGICEVKIPRPWSGIVPFCKNEVFKK